MGAPLGGRMSLYIEPKDDTTGLTFVHIPKCAGSSIKHALKEVFPTAVDTHFHHNIGNKNLKTYWSFAVFRDPIERAISMYNEVYNVLQTRPKTIEKITKLSAKDIIENITFDVFVTEWFNQSINGIKPSKEQLRYISDDSGIIVDKVIPFHKLTEQWAEVEEHCGKTIPLPTLRVGQFKTMKMEDTTRTILEQYYAKDIQYWNTIK